MKPPIRRSLVSSAIAAVLTASATAGADGLALNRFDPAPAGDPMFGVPSPTVAGQAVPRVGLLLDYAHNPLVLYDATTKANVGALVSSQLYLHINASLALSNQVGLNVVLPLALAQAGDNPTPGGQVLYRSPKSAEPGDVRAGIRFHLWGDPDASFQVGIGGYLWIPSGVQAQYVGDGQARGEVHALVGGRGEHLVWSFAVGPQFRGTHTLGGVTNGNQINVGAGLGFFLDSAHRLQLGPEAYAALTVIGGDASANDTFRRAANLEALVDLRYRFAEDWEIGAGAGPGLASGQGTPDFRGLLMAAYSPEGKRPPSDRDGDGIIDEQDACPDVRGVASSDPKTNGCPPDRDGDGIPDEQDACPDVKGVPTADPKTNGCPPDRDGDGIIDEQDACPDVKGVPTADPKTNGCPPDRDGDGIADDKDACPDVVGVATDDPKTNGCPPDRDGDGITDDKDACPEEKGEPDPDPKRNGCPIVHVTEKEIVILEQVQFDTNKATIKKASGPLLDKVAAVFKDHPEIKSVEVQGHTDNTGSAVLNRRLSHRRAEAVVDALVSRGVPTSELVFKGYGLDIPIADNGTEDGRRQNRRVQFKILEREPKNASQSEKGAGGGGAKPDKSNSQTQKKESP